MEIPDLIRSAVELEKSWRNKDYQFCFIGGIALQRWGEPRNTRDLDLTLLTGFGDESKFEVSLSVAEFMSIGISGGGIS